MKLFKDKYSTLLLFFRNWWNYPLETAKRPKGKGESIIAWFAEVTSIKFFKTSGH
jgi:hypothetical protein